jgi:hypothetical protein
MIRPRCNKESHLAGLAMMTTEEGNTMRAKLTSMGISILLLGTVHLALPSRALAGKVCLLESGFVFWQLSVVPEQKPLLAFGEVTFPSDRVPWLTFGLFSDTKVKMKAKNLFPTQGFECCTFECEGTKGSSFVTGTCTSPDTACNRNCGSAGRVTPWNAQILQPGQFPCAP